MVSVVGKAPYFAGSLSLSHFEFGWMGGTEIRHVTFEGKLRAGPKFKSMFQNVSQLRSPPVKTEPQGPKLLGACP